MHHEMYAVKGEFEELTLARGRRLLSVIPVCLLLSAMVFEASLYESL